MPWAYALNFALNDYLYELNRFGVVAYNVLNKEKPSLYSS